MSIAVIGAGTIGKAVVRALLARGDGLRIHATRRNVAGLADLEASGIVVGRDNAEAARNADTIILAVKPGDLLPALARLRDDIGRKLVISLAAAVPIALLKRAAPDAHFVRAMPNVAAIVRASFTPYCMAPEVTPEERARAIGLIEAIGSGVEVEEGYFDALTALSGSGPAYVFTIVEALMYAGIKAGLPRPLALRASLETLVGGAKLALEGGMHPAELRDMVVTPGGVAIEGIYELEDSAIRTAFMRAIEKATAKSALITEQIGNADGIAPEPGRARG